MRDLVNSIDEFHSLGIEGPDLRYLDWKEQRNTHAAARLTLQDSEA